VVVPGEGSIPEDERVLSRQLEAAEHLRHVDVERQPVGRLLPLPAEHLPGCLLVLGRDPAPDLPVRPPRLRLAQMLDDRVPHQVVLERKAEGPRVDRLLERLARPLDRLQDPVPMVAGIVPDRS
jgi:hypothetical protein